MYQRARLGIGYLPQGASIFRGLTVEQNIRSGPRSSSPTSESARPNSTRCCEINHHTARKSPSIALSGGERRRVEIARAPCDPPHYMLPTNLRRHRSDRGRDIQDWFALTIAASGADYDHNVRDAGLTDRAYMVMLARS